MIDQDEYEIVDRVWKALGITTYEGANGKAIYEIVAEQKAALAAAEKEIELVRAERQRAQKACEQISERLADAEKKNAELQLELNGAGVDKAILSGALKANENLHAEIARLRRELQWIADTPMQWTKPQNDVYWSNVAMALAKKAIDALEGLQGGTGE